MLAADFGPTNAFQEGPNSDGMVWRITPEGERTRVRDGDRRSKRDHPAARRQLAGLGRRRRSHLPAGRRPRRNLVARRALSERHGAVARRAHALCRADLQRDRPGRPRQCDLGDPDPRRPPGRAGADRRAHRTGSGRPRRRRAFGRIYIADNGSGSIRRFDPRVGRDGRRRRGDARRRQPGVRRRRVRPGLALRHHHRPRRRHDLAGQGRRARARRSADPFAQASGAYTPAVPSALYNRDILRLAASIPHQRRLERAAGERREAARRSAAAG